MLMSQKQRELGEYLLFSKQVTNHLSRLQGYFSQQRHSCVQNISVLLGFFLNTLRSCISFLPQKLISNLQFSLTGPGRNCRHVLTVRVCPHPHARGQPLSLLVCVLRSHPPQHLTFGLLRSVAPRTALSTWVCVKG